VASWADLEADAPDFAARVLRVFGSRRHKTVATLRRDGSPRISGIEVEFSEGEVWLGMMPASVKSLDLRRDPRLALHAQSEDPPAEDPGTWAGDAKLAGIAIEQAAPGQPQLASKRFKVDIAEVVLTRVGPSADHLLIEAWHPGRGLQLQRRR
jgi:hypothetical protein